MNKVFKYRIPLTELATVVDCLPGRILTVDMDPASPHEVAVWIQVEPNAEPTRRRFRIFGTGHPINEESYSYIGTAIDRDFGLVWHVYHLGTP